MPYLLGVDTGGTFTDAALLDMDEQVVAKAKALTTPHDLSIGVGGAIDAALAAAGVRPDEVALASLSTTLATNALVEGRGGRALLVAIGFDEADLTRAGLAAALGADPLIRIAGGHDAAGREAAPLDLEALRAALAGVGAVEGVAVAARFSTRNPAHEQAAATVLREALGAPVTTSAELSAKLNGPKRALTALLNARLIGLIAHLIDAAQGFMALRGITAPLMVVRGDGALISAAAARAHPIETILSGPAASLVGAAHLTGAPDALVSDIGGTTTDVALLRGGRPRIDAEGARVGGWRTMVEAAAVRTEGLGGDSLITLDESAFETRLTLGPRRAVPISLLAAQHPAVVHAALDRQLSTGAPGALDGRFARALGGRTPASLTGREAELMAQLQGGPLPLDRLLATRRDQGVLERLVARGHAILCAFTPSDAAHVAGLHDAWDAAAARKAAALFARKRLANGAPCAAGAEEIAALALDAMRDRTVEVLLEAAFAEDGFSGEGLARHALTRAALRGPQPGAALGLSLRLQTPLVPLGASAATYYPAVAAALGADMRLSEHADVANAVGAVVGRVRGKAEAAINQFEPGVFNVSGLGAPRRFTDERAAMDWAKTEALRLAEERARALGAADLTLTSAVRENAAEIEGARTLIEAIITAEAAGRARAAE